MWSLITASSTGHLRGTKSPAAAGGRRTGSGPEPLSEFVTNDAARRGCRVERHSDHDEGTAT